VKRALLAFAALSLVFVAGCGRHDDHSFVDLSYLFATHPGTGQLQSFKIASNGAIGPVRDTTNSFGLFTTGGRPEDLRILSLSLGTTYVFDGNETNNQVDVLNILPDGTMHLILGGAGSGVPPNNTGFSTGGAGTKAVAPDPLGRFLYAYNNGDNTISSFLLNNPSGRLTPGAAPNVVGAPGASGGADTGAAIVDPSGRFFFVANNNSIASATINQSTGLITGVSAIAIAGGPVEGIATANVGGVLVVYTANTGGSVGAFTVSGGGVLTPVPGQPFATAAANVESVVVDTTAQTLFASLEGAAAVQEFAIGAGGVLAATGAAGACGGACEGLAIDWTNNFLYAANDDQETIAAFVLNKGNGRLTAGVPGSPFATGIPAAAERGPDGLATLHLVVEVSDND
jgi:6-phosphogluconolactonase (cycloisomerase 2 family)